MQFINSNNNVKIIPKKQTEHLSNFYIGNDISKWGEGCKSFTQIQYQNIYNNIDANYYTSNGTLKYDIIVNAGGNINDIDLLEAVDVPIAVDPDDKLRKHAQDKGWETVYFHSIEVPEKK